MERVQRRCFTFGGRKRAGVVACEDARSSGRDDEEEVADGDALLKCFRPLLSSMRVFGLYFTPTSSPCVHDVDTSRSTSTTSTVSRRTWNKGRIYAVIMLVILWLDTTRNMWSVMSTRTYITRKKELAEYLGSGVATIAVYPASGLPYYIGLHYLKTTIAPGPRCQ